MKKKVIIALTIPVIGIGTYLGLSVLMPVAEPSKGIVTEQRDEYEQETTIEFWAKPIVPEDEVVIISDDNYLSMSVENINITVNATKNQKKGGDDN